MESEHQVPIWFFVGFLLLVYGLLIVGAGIYALQVPSDVQINLKASWPQAPWFFLHADLWWGGVMVLVGAGYCYRFHPWPRARPSRAGLTTDHLRHRRNPQVDSQHASALFRHLARLDRSSYNCFEIERSMAFHWLFLISIAAGFVGAMAGMGGGVVLIPVLTMLHVDIKKAIAISIVSVIATSSGSASAYVRDRITNLKVGMFLEMFTIVGALIGAAITLVAGQNFLFILFGLVLLLSWLALFAQRNRQWQPPARQDAFSRWLELEGSYYDHPTHKTIKYRAIRAYFGGPLMFGGGLVAGMLGIGAGGLEGLDPRPRHGPAAQGLHDHQQPDHRRHGAGRRQRLPGCRPGRSPHGRAGGPGHPPGHLPRHEGPRPLDQPGRSLVLPVRPAGAGRRDARSRNQGAL